MALSQEAQALVTKLEAVHARAFGGDREAVHFIQSLKTRALSGDAQARRIYNTLAVLHWRKQRSADYDKAEIYYRRLVAKDPRAMAKLQVLLNRVRQGDAEMLTLFRVLKSIHGKYKSSAFSDGPGAPRIGGYGLPQEHRPGIIIGAAPPLVDGLERGQNFYNTGTPLRTGAPMRTIPFIPRPRVSGGTFWSGGLPRGAGFVVGATEPLTAAAVTNLIGLMVKARALPFGAAITNLLSQVQSQVQQAFSTNTVPASTAFTTTPPPSGLTTVAPRISKPPPAPGTVVSSLGRAPPVVSSLGRIATTPAQQAALLANQGVCNLAASATARGSAAAPGLRAQCVYQRRANVLAGSYFADKMSPDDEGYRTALTDAGLAVTAKNPQLKAFSDSLMTQDPSGAKSRGFTIAMGVRNGQMDPAFPAFVRPGLAPNPNLLAGFDLGMSLQ